MIPNAAPVGVDEDGEAARRHVHHVSDDLAALLLAAARVASTSSTAKQANQCGGICDPIWSEISAMPPLSVSQPG